MIPNPYFTQIFSSSGMSSSSTISTTSTTTTDVSTGSEALAATVSTASVSIDDNRSVTLSTCSSCHSKDTTSLVLSPPRLVHVHPDPKPYAQLCVRHDKTITAQHKPLCILMIGKHPGPKSSCTSPSKGYFSLMEDQKDADCNTSELTPSPLLLKADPFNMEGDSTSGRHEIDSSSSESSYNNVDVDGVSGKNIMVLDDWGWACNGWEDLRMSSSSTSSNDSSFNTPRIRNGADTFIASTEWTSISSNYFGSLGPEMIVWQDANWVEMQNEDNSMADAWRLLGDCLTSSDSSSCDAKVDNWPLDSATATGCGRVIRTFRRGINTTNKPYKKAAHVRCQNQTTKPTESVKLVDLEYSALS